ncbi:MAG: SpoIIE family protein phosphatase [Flavobacteriales bacterium]|nr:SpoIIE family protein phosphatase [Flavobacteriales bacterium]
MAHHGPGPIGTRPQRQGACKCARGERFITPVHRHNRYREAEHAVCECGTNDPLLHHAGKASPPGDGSIALGMMPQLPFLLSGEVDLPPNSTLLCYTGWAGVGTGGCTGKVL